MRRLIEQGHVNGSNFIQVGLRGFIPSDDDLAWMRDQGFRYHFMAEVERHGWDHVMERAITEAAEGTDYLYVSLDIDVLDPAYAPGTGTPEPNGLTPATALVLEVIGFSLGPVLIVVLLAAAVLLVLRPIVQNVSSGLILQLRGSCLPGDVVEINGEVGVVQEVNARAVVLETIDGRTVLFPNDEVIANKLVNHSTRGARRADMVVRIPGATDVSSTTAGVIDSLALLDSVRAEPAPAVQVTGFDGAHMWIAVQFWSDPDPEAQEAARDQVGRALRDLFVASELALSNTTIAIAEPTAATGSR